MSSSYLRLTRSETRELAEREHRTRSGLDLGQPAAWPMSNTWFFTAFVVIVALLAVLALVLHSFA